METSLALIRRCILCQLWRVASAEGASSGAEDLDRTEGLQTGYWAGLGLYALGHVCFR
ncbi:hypothetical protein BS78_03G174500 [Paspalum vaginatum]|nr:hypothetical protein BS78_03G174500 [Paspalum vaginatum]